MFKCFIWVVKKMIEIIRGWKYKKAQIFRGNYPGAMGPCGHQRIPGSLESSFQWAWSKIQCLAHELQEHIKDFLNSTGPKSWHFYCKDKPKIVTKRVNYFPIPQRKKVNTFSYLSLNSGTVHTENSYSQVVLMGI